MDANSRPRELNAGDEVLILLPTEKFTLLLQWKGPFTIKEHKNEVDRDSILQREFQERAQ